MVGENVVGVDRESELENGRINSAPELDRRIDTFLRYYDGYGAIIVQMNVEDTRNGVAEYLIDKYGDKVIIELKWGQGAKDIGGEIQVTDLEYAQFLKDRGYVVDPEPLRPHGAGGLQVPRHHLLRAPQPPGRHQPRRQPTRCEKDFMDSVAYLRELGYKRISLKTGAYGMEALAMAIRYAADCQAGPADHRRRRRRHRHEPLEHDGALGRALAAPARQDLRVLPASWPTRGIKVPDISLAGGFAREDHIFKALALCAPYTKLVCMGRAPMIPGFLGSNIEGVFKPEKRAELNGHWEELPAVGEGSSGPTRRRSSPAGRR